MWIDGKDPGVDDAVQLWTVVAKTIREHVPEGEFRTWFEPIEPLSLEDDTIVLGVLNGVARKRLVEGTQAAVIRDALVECGLGDLEVSFRLISVPDIVDLEPAGYLPGSNGSEGGPDATAAPNMERLGALSPDSNFDNFVIGSSNRFAHAAALSVAEKPAASYNPLFIYGPSGLGKTHLLKAIGHYVLQHYPGFVVRYVVLESMLNEFYTAIQNNDTAAFKRRYRDCDVLLVDDIQFISGKERLQEEFFHTFSTLRDAGRQVVLTSDRTPDEIDTIEDRLRTRFKWGLITDIQPPDLETRIAILRNKADADGHDVPDDVFEFIASHITENIRELEGALISVTAFAYLNHEPIGLTMCRDVLKDVSGSMSVTVTPEAILDATATQFGFPVDELTGKSRRRPLVLARQISMYAFRQLTEFSFPAIGREFGDRDHTTVMHAVEKITGLMTQEREVYDQVQTLVQTIKSPRPA